MFGIVTCIAEFVGGGIRPWARVDAIRLFPNIDGWGIATSIAEILFLVATFYYVVMVIMAIKREGCAKFFDSTWNVIDFFTVGLSIIAIILYTSRMLLVREMTKEFNETQGNKYIRLTYVAMVDEYYTYVLGTLIFASTLKFNRLLGFQKTFMQVSATIRLCFTGLSTFFVEFVIVFLGFTSFFYFVLKDAVDDFRDFVRAVENTMAMSIGKFNFGELRAADEIAAWIFFIFSVVVNMILINMIMAIINFALEEIKENEEDFQNKFELLDYLKRISSEMIGLMLAEPIVPVYLDDDDLQNGEDEDEDGCPTEAISKDFNAKTDMLLKYIEATYLSGFLDDNGEKVVNKMKKSDPGDRKIIDYGFDALFGDGKRDPEEGQDGEDKSREGDEMESDSENEH